MQSDITPSFGGFITKKRENLKLTLTELSGAVGITPAYLHFIESGKKINPSKEIIYKMAAELGLSKDECYIFLDLHAKANNKISLDLPDYLMSNDIARKAVRRAKENADKEFTDKEWQNFMDKLNTKK